MTIDEEIQNQEEKALAYKIIGNQLSVNISTEQHIMAKECYDISEHHRQIAEWLKELRAYKEAREEIGCLPIVWEEGAGIRKCIDILDKHLMEVENEEN